MQTIAPDLVTALLQGDDGLLRFVIKLFESRGFQVCGAHELLPQLTAVAGLLSDHAPNFQHLADIDKGFAMLNVLSAVDIGQSTVFEYGLCLGVETLEAGLAGLAITAGQVLILEPEQTHALIAQYGLFLIVRAL
jgi:DUF1009 family protein